MNENRFHAEAQTQRRRGCQERQVLVFFVPLRLCVSPAFPHSV